MTKRFVPSHDPKKVALTPGHAVAGEFRRVPVSDVHVLEHLNLRVRGTPEYDAAVEEFAASIAANGFYDDKPLAGYLDADNRVIVIDGHRRLEAVRRLNEGALDPVVTDIPVVLKAEDSTLADLTVAMIQSSTGTALTMFEKGIGVRRLMADGMTKEDVARRLGVTEKSVDNYLAVASVPAKARDLLLDNKVTSTQVLRSKGDVAKLQAMVEKAASKGRTRARPSDAEPQPGTPESLLKVAEKPILDGNPRAEAVEIDYGTGVVPPADDALTFTVDIVKDAEMGALMRQIAAEIRARVQHEQGDSDAALVAGTVTVSIAIEKPKRTRRKAAAAPVETPAEEPDLLAHALPADDL